MAAGSNPVANELASAPAAEPTQPVAELSEADLAYLTELKRHRDSIVQTLQYYDLVTATSTLDDKFFGHLFIILFSWSVFYDGALALEPTPMFAELDARYDAALEPFDTLAHQIEPELDQLLTGEASQPTLSGFDYDVMTATVAAARPELESVVAEIDQALTAGGIS
jgi:hypothetical protein